MGTFWVTQDHKTLECLYAAENTQDRTTIRYAPGDLLRPASRDLPLEIPLLELTICRGCTFIRCEAMR
eukprot:6377466-Pyramimonas_sp.AAC.2